MLTARQTVFFRRNMQIDRMPGVILKWRALKWRASYPRNDWRHYKITGVISQNDGRHST